MTAERLADQRCLWGAKAVLREIYHDYYARMVAECREGITIEIGGGSGNLKSFLNNVVSTDIVWSPWLDAAADAQRLPLKDGCVDNILGLDVLHHIEYPMTFLREAMRVLKPGGRVILIEPGISYGSYAFYRWLHPEPVQFAIDPFSEGARDIARLPFDANQAIPTLLFESRRRDYETYLPGLRIACSDWLSLFAYPLSGGFRSWSLIPAWLVRPLIKCEGLLPRAVRRLMGFRLFVVLEKVS